MSNQKRRGRRSRPGGRNQAQRNRNRRSSSSKRTYKTAARPSARRQPAASSPGFWSRVSAFGRGLFAAKPKPLFKDESFLEACSIEELPALLTQFPELVEKISTKALRVIGNERGIIQPRRLQHLVHDNYLFIQQESRLSDYINERMSRQFEFCLPHWLDGEERSFIACGYLGSDFCYSFFRLAQMFGWDLQIFYVREEATETSLEQLREILDAGIRVKFFETRKALDSALKRQSLFSFFKKSKTLPFEGVDEYAILAYASAYIEVSSGFGTAEMPRPKFLFTSVNAPVVVAGLELGRRLMNDQQIEVWGIASNQSKDFDAHQLAALCDKAQALLAPCGEQAKFSAIGPTEFKIFESRGPKRGSLEAQDYERWVQQLCSSQLIELDNKNSAPGLLGMSEFLRLKRIQKTPVLFWNTYGGVKANSFKASLRRCNFPSKVEAWRKSA